SLLMRCVMEWPDIPRRSGNHFPCSVWSLWARWYSGLVSTSGWDWMVFAAVGTFQLYSREYLWEFWPYWPLFCRERIWFGLLSRVAALCYSRRVCCVHWWLVALGAA